MLLQARPSLLHYARSHTFSKSLRFHRHQNLSQHVFLPSTTAHAAGQQEPGDREQQQQYAAQQQDFVTTPQLLHFITSRTWHQHDAEQDVLRRALALQLVRAASCLQLVSQPCLQLRTYSGVRPLFPRTLYNGLCLYRCYMHTGISWKSCGSTSPSRCPRWLAMWPPIT